MTLTSSGKGYIYAATDMTGLYNRPDQWNTTKSAVDITRAQRNIFWLNDDYIVVYDRATSKSSGLFKRFNLALVAHPAISGPLAKETMASGQQLFIHTLLPHHFSTSVREADTDLNPIADLEPTKYVLTVEATADPKDIRFLHVLEGADRGVSATTVTGFSSTSGTVFDGALVGSTALLFLHDDTQAPVFVQTVYSEPSTVTENLVAGLKPATGYTVTMQTSAGKVQVTIHAGGTVKTDAAGVLVF